MSQIPDIKEHFDRISSLLRLRDQALMGILIQFLEERGVSLSVDDQDDLSAAADYFGSTEQGQLSLREIAQIGFSGPSVS